MNRRNLISPLWSLLQSWSLCRLAFEKDFAPSPDLAPVLHSSRNTDTGRLQEAQEDNPGGVCGKVRKGTFHGLRRLLSGHPSRVVLLSLLKPTCVGVPGRVEERCEVGRRLERFFQRRYDTNSNYVINQASFLTEDAKDLSTFPLFCP